MNNQVKMIMGMSLKMKEKIQKKIMILKQMVMSY